MRGPAATAVWAAGGSIANFTNPLVQAMTNYIGPAAAAGFAIGGRPSLQRIMRSTSWLFVVAMMPACIAILIWGGWIVAAFYGSDYAGTGPVASLLMLNVVPVGLSVIASRGLFAVERADVDFRVNLIPLAMAAAVGVPMIRFYGAAGAAAAAFLANVAATAVRYRRVAVSGLTIGTTAGL
jgi:O-antigen/teichoic acid export membrane protein